MKHDQYQPTANGNDERLLTRIEVEQRFGVPKRFLELAIARDDGPRYVRIGRLVRYRARDVSLWIEEQASDP